MAQPSEMQRMLVPEEFTHLYHTTCYTQLSQAQRLKYNQLYGLRINEQFIQFEEVFIKGLMPRLKRHSALKDNPRMLAGMESVLRDEEQHSLMFARFNQEIRPDLYRLSPDPFTRLSTLKHSLLRMLLATPGLLPGLLWLMLAMEELTTAISNELISHPQSDELSQAYIALHQRHQHDEQRHVSIDMKMVLGIQEHTPQAVHKINAALFRKVFLNILRPRRSTIQVIQRLTLEEPELKDTEQAMIDEIKALDTQTAFPANLIKPDKLPVLHGLFTRFPDYQLSTLYNPVIN